MVQLTHSFTFTFNHHTAFSIIPLKICKYDNFLFIFGNGHESGSKGNYMFKVSFRWEKLAGMSCMLNTTTSTGARHG